MNNIDPLTIKRDRFELISAYLDGEVTADERRQVEAWLDNEPEVQALYERLLKLHQGWDMMPVPPATVSVEETIDAVFSRLDKKEKPRLIVLWGGASAIAAMFVAAISSLFFSGDRLQFVEQKVSPPITSPSNAAVAPMRMALDQPVVNIPKKPVTAP
ncbi:MAG: anti-sigma factor [Hormoscilla sp.]